MMTIGTQYVPSGCNMYHWDAICTIGMQYVPSGRNMYHRGASFNHWDASFVYPIEYIHRIEYIWTDVLPIMV